MISVNLAEDQISEYLSKAGSADFSSISKACINSPSNCTLSGPELSIDQLKLQLDRDGIFAQKLKTGIAYHSESMSAVAQEYMELMGTLESDEQPTLDNAVLMISSVTGDLIHPHDLAKGQYWTENLVSQVRFLEAVQKVVSQDSSHPEDVISGFTDFVELGPHATLKRPLQDILHQPGNSKITIRYYSVLNKHRPAMETVLELLGHLFCSGYKVLIGAVNQQSSRTTKLLVDCPQYPFDHSNRYWAESRISRDFRMRQSASNDILGSRCNDWNPLEPRWRNFWSVESTPWVSDHIVRNSIGHQIYVLTLFTNSN